MADHILDYNTDESSYFSKQNKNGKAAYRHAVVILTGGLPLWAMGVRKVVTSKVVTQAKVVTLPVVTVLSFAEERMQPGYVDPLTLI
jgi:hypothetical protein